MRDNASGGDGPPRGSTARAAAPAPLADAAWPPAKACQRLALLIFGVALVSHLVVGSLALTAGLSLPAAAIVAELIALFGVSVWFAWRLGLSWQPAFALYPARRIHWVMAVVAAAPLQLAAGALQYAILQASPEPLRQRFEQMMRDLTRWDSPGDWAMLLVAGVIVAAICEELLFRGLIMQLLARKRGWTAAILFAAFLFSAFHLDPIGLVPRAAVGAYLGLLVWRSGSLYPAIAAHGANNLLGLVAVPLLADQATGQGQPQRLAFVGVAAAALFIGLVYLYLRMSEPPSTTADDEPPTGRLSGAERPSEPMGTAPPLDSTHRRGPNES